MEGYFHKQPVCKAVRWRLHLEGQLTLFVIYETEEENMPVQWMEEVIPFSGDIEIAQAHEGQIPMVSLRLAHGEVEAKRIRTADAGTGSWM